MAHMSTGVCPGGPYPDKAGEYCGNHPKGHQALCMYGQPQSEADAQQRAWLATMRFGRPRPCKAGTSEEMEARGYVGLYLKESRTLFDWEVFCPTPPELMEPAEAKDGGL